MFLKVEPEMEERLNPPVRAAAAVQNRRAHAAQREWLEHDFKQKNCLLNFYSIWPDQIRRTQILNAPAKAATPP